jgi:hypothetical protein
VHPYETNSGTGGIWGELYGSEVNHSTLVWYMQEEAVQWLG